MCIWNPVIFSTNKRLAVPVNKTVKCHFVCSISVSIIETSWGTIDSGNIYTSASSVTRYATIKISLKANLATEQLRWQRLHTKQGC